MEKVQEYLLNNLPGGQYQCITVGQIEDQVIQGDHLHMCQKFLFISQAIIILMTSEVWQNFRSIQTFFKIIIPDIMDMLGFLQFMY